MGKLEFVPDDFNLCDCAPWGGHHLDECHSKRAADEANARLEQMLAEAPEVFIDADSDIWVPNDQRDGLGNHPVKGRLVNVEKIDG